MKNINFFEEGLKSEFENFSKDKKIIIKDNINYIIENMFISVADSDYAASRVLFQNLLNRQSYWYAAQALEKYFKAILLVNGQSVKRFGHSLSELLNKIDISLELYLTSSSTLEQSEPSDKFNNVAELVKFIEDNGSTNNRYAQNDMISRSVNPIVYIQQLDHLIFYLRNVCLEYKKSLLHQHSFVNNLLWEAVSCENIHFDGNIFKSEDRVVMTSSRFVQSDCVSTLRVVGVVCALDLHPDLKNFFKKWIKQNIKIHENDIKRLLG